FPDPSIREILGSDPQIRTNLHWDASTGLHLQEGIMNAGAGQGNFHGTFDADNKLALSVNAAAQDMAPYFIGLVKLDADINGMVDNPELALRLHSDQVTLESGMEIHGIEAVFDGDLQNNHLSISAALEDGEYKI